MSFIEDTVQVIEILQKCKEFLDSRNLLRFLCIVLVVSGMMFAIISIPVVSDILAPMNETIRALVFMVMLASGLCSVSVILINLAEYFYDSKMAEKKRQNEEAEMRRQLKNLGKTERRILKYVLNQEGNVWLPADNITVLSLYNRGMLIPMTGASVHRGDMYKGGQCFAYSVSDKLRECICEKELLSTPDWQSISEQSGMEIYQ